MSDQGFGFGFGDGNEGWDGKVVRFADNITDLLSVAAAAAAINGEGVAILVVLFGFLDKVARGSSLMTRGSSLILVVLFGFLDKVTRG